MKEFNEILLKNLLTTDVDHVTMATSNEQNEEIVMEKWIIYNVSTGKKSHPVKTWKTWAGVKKAQAKLGAGWQVASASWYQDNQKELTK